MSKIGDIAIGFVIGVGSVLGLGFWLDKKEKTVDSASSNDIEATAVDGDNTTETDYVEADATDTKNDATKADEDKENTNAEM